MSSYYEILGVPPGATAAEIRRRYRELARRLHPDVSPSQAASHHAFSRITEAYSVLSDPRQRADYDREIGIGYWVLGIGTGPNTQYPIPNTQYLTPGARVDVDLGGTILVCRLRDSGVQAFRDPRGERECAKEAKTSDGERESTKEAKNAKSNGWGSSRFRSFRPFAFSSEIPERLTLLLPRGARRESGVGEGARVTLTLYRPDDCLEAETTVERWVWARPSLLVTGPVEAWRPSPRRRPRRLPREIEARLSLEGAGEFTARTMNVSASGLLLLLRGCPAAAVGTAGHVALFQGEGCRGKSVGSGPSHPPPYILPPSPLIEALPCRVARVLHWLRPSGRTVEVGVQLLPGSETERRGWQQCLARLGVGQDEVVR